MSFDPVRFVIRRRGVRYPGACRYPIHSARPAGCVIRAEVRSLLVRLSVPGFGFRSLHRFGFVIPVRPVGQHVCGTYYEKGDLVANRTRVGGGADDPMTNSNHYVGRPALDALLTAAVFLSRPWVALNAGLCQPDQKEYIMMARMKATGGIMAAPTAVWGLREPGRVDPHRTIAAAITTTILRLQVQCDSVLGPASKGGPQRLSSGRASREPGDRTLACGPHLGDLFIGSCLLHRRAGLHELTERLMPLSLKTPRPILRRSLADAKPTASPPVRCCAACICEIVVLIASLTWWRPSSPCETLVPFR
ncbi:unnamed protein product [Boreogadus saida]